ncbi:MAG: hypothetical protein ACRC2T_02655 [Thermoguttaceae bacterium]
MPETVNKERTITTRKPTRIGAMLLLVIGVTILGTVFFADEISRIRLHHLIYRLDFRYWPDKLGTALWLFFAVIMCELCVRKNLPVTRFCKWISILLAFVEIILVALGIYCITTTIIPLPTLMQWLYYNCIVPYFHEPMSQFIYNGTITNNLIVAPAIALFLIITLAFIGIRVKKRKANHDANTDRK